MWQCIDDVETKIVNEVLKKYKELGKQGKPILHETKAEWTVLASIVMIQCSSRENYSIQVISIGTGLKCLPFSKLCKTGDAINDSHAEIIAHRGFIKYLIDQIQSPPSSSSPFQYKNDRLVLDPSYSLHMYISQSPCGDASMSALADIQSAESMEAFENGKNKRKRVDDLYPFLIENIYANKKKKLSTTTPQFQRGRFRYDQLGILRTKPGRLDSEPTLCMSCSDKMARWNILGLQSALLSNLYDPIYLDSIIVGDMFDREALERALYKRLEPIQDLPEPYRLNKPKLSPTKIIFESSKSHLEGLNKYKAVVSCGTSISWVINMPKSEVYVNGLKQGAPKNKPPNTKTRPSICKKSLYQQLLNKLDKEQNKSYFDWKNEATVYQQAKSCLLDQLFDTWVQTPSEFENFGVE